MGAKYRLNVSDLPGSPDIANKSRRKAVFVHGCFWHLHEECPRARLPKANREWWRQKLLKNRGRDRRKTAALKAEGFDVITIWECELQEPAAVQESLRRFWLGEPS